MEKVVIIGSGMAGLTAAIYAGRANLSPLVVSGREEGGQLMLTSEVENYPGFPEGILGPELISKCREQAKKFGARFVYGDLTAFSVKGQVYALTVGDAQDMKALETQSVIIATGASARMLGLESEKRYFSRGVHTCATCDAYFYREKDVAVIGGGDSACEESLFLSKLVKSVTIIHRKEKLRASKIMQERVFSNDKIRIIWNSAVEELLGDGMRVTGIKIRDLVAGIVAELSTAAVFLAIGHVPNTSVFRGVLELDELGFLKADLRMHTSLPGVFAAGDAHDRTFRQAVTAAGMGCQAALEAERYLEGIDKE